MNKKLWGVIIIFVAIASYGMYKVIFYNPIDSITKAKLDLSTAATKATESPSALGPLAPQVNDNYLIGKWQSTSDAGQIIEYQADNTFIEYTAAKPAAKGTWKFETTAGAAVGKGKVLKISINGRITTYQILNLSATNLSYITGVKKGIESFSRLP